MTLAFFSSDLLLVLTISILVTVIVALIFGFRLKAVYNYMFKWKELDIKLSELSDEYKDILFEAKNLKASLEESNAENQKLKMKLADVETRLKDLEEKVISPSKERTAEKEDIIIEYYMGNEHS